MLLSCCNLIYKCLLFAGGSVKIYTGSLDAFIPHKISKQSNIIIFFEKILNIAMTKGIRINYLL